MDGMKSPLARVKVDSQGRLVLPRHLRDEVVEVPGEVFIRRTADGLLVTPAETAGILATAPDGMAVLTLGRRVANSEVLAAIDQERSNR